MKKKALFVGLMGFLIILWQTSAEAARSFTVTQTNPAPPAPVTMGTTVSFTFRITNTNTGGNSGERIYEVRFRLPGTGNTFSSTTAAPVGWTRTAYSTTSVTFRASSWNNSIATAGNGPTTFMDFTLVLVLRTTSADTTETLRDARSSYTTTTTGPPFTRLSRVTVSNPGSWALKSLEITSFQFTDLSGNPVTSVVSGTSFRLVMTVRNRSTVTQSSIVSNPPSPTPVKNGAGGTTGTVNESLTSTVYSPNPLTLASGASGTITFTYSTNSNDDGTIYFTANARNNSNNATSATATSPTLDVSRFSAGITISPACAYNGQNITVTMLLTNGFPYNIINVTPTLNTAGAPVSYVSGPSPSSPNGPVPADGTFTFTWTYQISGGTIGQTFNFTGSATGTGQTGGNPTRTTSTSTSNTARRGGYNITLTLTPDQVDASSTNQELLFSVENQGCANVNSVSIAIPSGWTTAGDNYSLIEQAGSNPPLEDTWTVSSVPGTNPVVFTASGGQLPLDLASPKSGDFAIVFSTTPATNTVDTFNVTITDANGTPLTKSGGSVTVNSFNTAPGGGNYTRTQILQENFP
jgi:hypothetical protein